MDKLKFYDKIKENRQYARFNSVSMDKAKYLQIINKVKLAKENHIKDSNKHKFLKRYDVIQEKGTSKLISPITSGTIQYFIYDEKLFDVLSDAHKNTNHAGRDRMINYLRHKYTNITYRDVQIYLNLCEPCQQKLSKKQQKQICKKPNVIVEPMLLKELNSRCQIDLIDLQLKPDGDYRFILCYQDHLTKFVILKPLKSKTSEEICENIIEIFTLFGAPSVLHSENGKEYVNKIMESLKNIWPNFKIIYGQPSLSQKSIEEVKTDVQKMITNWMEKNNNSKWSEGLKFIQFTKNTTLHQDIMKTPYEAMFGCLSKNGLASFNIPLETFEFIQCEGDLKNEIEMVNSD